MDVRSKSSTDRKSNRHDTTISGFFKRQKARIDEKGKIMVKGEGESFDSSESSSDSSSPQAAGSAKGKAAAKQKAQKAERKAKERQKRKSVKANAKAKKAARREAKEAKKSKQAEANRKAAEKATEKNEQKLAEDANKRKESAKAVLGKITTVLADLELVRGDGFFDDLPQPLKSKINEGIEKAAEVKRDAFLTSVSGDVVLDPALQGFRDVTQAFAPYTKQVALANGVIKLMRK